jgi:DNA-binding transcriptional LysR family regulator|tara:strand:- start:136 stop:1095 length:960 start_codon:yes stop_codon:yes gene_type:complete
MIIGISVMNISRVDLNLLVYLDVLLTETSVSKAAAKLGITQPAMSNGLKRLRDLFGDPLLVRTGGGMQPTERALSLRPALREAILLLEKTVQPQNEFDAANSDRVFRIMASDYGEATLLPSLLDKMANRAPNICLDVLTPSDVGIEDLEQGKVDMAINRFDQMPNSFHQTTIWHDNFSCVLHKDNPLVDDFTLDNYLSERHIWVSKTGMGRGVGINPGQSMRLGRLDEALSDLDLHRNIAVFTRHYQVAILLARQPHLVATVPTRLAKTLEGDSSLVIKKLPFSIAPFELKMIWSPLLHHNPEHIWLRRLVQECADELK